MAYRFIAKIALLVALLGLPASAQELANLAQSLIDLRAEVETLHTQVDDAKSEFSTRMKSLNVQRTDIEASIARQELKIKQIETQLDKIKERIAQKSSGSSALKEVAKVGLEQLKAVLPNELPFKIKDRIAQIDEIQGSIAQNLTTPEKALGRAWSIYEDNFRMSRENGLFRQNITIGSKEYLADVVRIGNTMMFFKTTDGTMGYFAKSGATWMPMEIVESKRKELVDTLFDSMKKQIRSGFFILPYALNTGAAQ
ncbi:MAG: hypothetical protein KU37_04140 [Sulfuricurvum sp. PC08-66]|nr:MAG: hypothetical protein KU37_04140 [Sulfuricurvum sp. PC08-66]